MQLKKRIKEYFSFTLKERIGILVLIVLVFVVFILPGWIRGSKNLKDAEVKEINEASVKLDDNPYVRKKFFDSDDGDNRETNRNYALAKPAKLFYFDPNKASKEEWERLGVRDKTIRTILNYLSKGGHFYKPEDLKKIYGLHEELVERLIPFVRLPEQSMKRFSSFERSKKSELQQPEKEYGISTERKRAIAIDINKADSADFESLPGIGSRLAGRIVHFREKLGGFYSLEQVRETYGLMDSTFDKIRPMLRLSEATVRRININKSDVYVLRNHPYIGWQIANLLVRYRQQNGDFRSVETILAIGGISPEAATKLLPYLSID